MKFLTLKRGYYHHRITHLGLHIAIEEIQNKTVIIQRVRGQIIQNMLDYLEMY